MMNLRFFAAQIAVAYHSVLIVQYAMNFATVGCVNAMASQIIANCNDIHRALLQTNSRSAILLVSLVVISMTSSYNII